MKFCPSVMHPIASNLYILLYDYGSTSTTAGVVRFNLQDNKIYTSYTISGTYPGYFEYVDYGDDPSDINSRFHSIIARRHNSSYLQIFITLTTGLLCGYISKSINTGYPIFQDVGVLLSVPKPYYFQMGAPDTRSIQVLNESLYIKKSNTHIITYPNLFPSQLTLTNVTVPYYYDPAMSDKMNQPVEITGRKLLLPATLPTHIIQYLGDNVQVITIDNCTYDQAGCNDTEYIQYIQSTDGSNLNSKFTFVESANTLYIALSKNLSAVGNYTLKFKCRIQDGLTNETTFVVEYKYDGRSFSNQNQSTNTTNNTTANNTNATINRTTSYNLAPMFYTKLQGFTIRAGGTAVLYLPDFFDPNGDNVKISAKHNGINTDFFKFLDDKRMEFNAKLKDLGDQDIMIILTDDNINPLSTKYRIIVKVLQSDLVQMNNTDVVKSNLSDIISIQDTSKFKIQQISPTGLISIKFEKLLNSTNQTQLLSQIYESLRLQIEDQSITFNWTVVYAEGNVIQIKISFSNPLLVQSNGMDKTQLKITLTNPSLFFNTGTNKSMSYSTYVPPQLLSGSLRFDYLFSNLLVQSAFDIPEQDAYNDNFRDFGYDSYIAIENIGFNTFLLLISPILIIITLILQYLARFVPKFDQGYGVSISIMPFDTMLNNIMELINEGLVLFTGQILILFTDYDPNPEHRYMIGWVILSAIAFVSLLNMSLILKYRKIRHKQRIRQRSTIIAGKQHYQKIKSINRKLFIKYLTKSGSQVQTEKRG
eukprot:403339465